MRLGWRLLAKESEREPLGAVPFQSGCEDHLSKRLVSAMMRLFRRSRPHSDGYQVPPLLGSGESVLAGA